MLRELRIKNFAVVESVTVTLRSRAQRAHRRDRRRQVDPRSTPSCCCAAPAPRPTSSGPMPRPRPWRPCSRRRGRRGARGARRGGPWPATTAARSSCGASWRARAGTARSSTTRRSRSACSSGSATRWSRSTASTSTSGCSSRPASARAARPLRRRRGGCRAGRRPARQAPGGARGGRAGARSAERDRAQREDLLRFQVRELDAARLQVGRGGRAAGGAPAAAACRALHCRAGRGARRCSTRRRSPPPSGWPARPGSLQDLGRLDPAFGAPGERDRGRRRPAGRGAGARSAACATASSAEPGRLDAIDERLDALARLKRKYGDSEAAMLALPRRGRAASSSGSSATTRCWPSRSACWPSSRRELTRGRDVALRAASRRRRQAGRPGGAGAARARAWSGPRSRSALEPDCRDRRRAGLDRVELRLSHEPRRGGRGRWRASPRAASCRARCSR